MESLHSARASALLYYYYFTYVINGSNLVLFPNKFTLYKSISAITIDTLVSASAELCQMQIGQKMMKVQKIIMPKSAVEDMQKKGYLEMKVSSTEFNIALFMLQTDYSGSLEIVWSQQTIVTTGGLIFEREVYSNSK